MSQSSPITTVITTVNEELSAQFTKDQLVEMLSTENIYEVVFEKKDGTIRTMYCSRNSSFIPAKPETITESATSDPKPARKENPNVVPVYDLQKSAWRSFTVSSVKSIRTVEAVPEVAGQ